MSSRTSRKLRQNRRYDRTHVTITWGSNLRFQNKGGRHYLIPPLYQIRSCNTLENKAVKFGHRRLGVVAA
jgi:hypothetical protein